MPNDVSSTLPPSGPGSASSSTSTATAASAARPSRRSKGKKKADDRPLTNLFASPWDSEPGSITDSSGDEAGDDGGREEGAHKQKRAGDEAIIRGSAGTESGILPEQEESIIDRKAIVRYYADPTKEPVTFDVTRKEQEDSSGDAPLAQGSSSVSPTALPEHYDVTLRLDVTNGCGGKIWPAAEVLGAYIASSPHYRPSSSSGISAWKGKTVVELGSGTGLVGLLVARMGLDTAGVWITDQIPMMQLMHDNLALTNARAPLPDPVHIAELNWGEAEEGAVPAPPPNPLNLGEPVPGKPDILLLADCVYLEIAFRPLVDTLLALSRTPSSIAGARARSTYADPAHDDPDPACRETEILFCYVKRRKADGRFFGMLKKKFAFEDVSDDDPVRTQRYRKGSTQLMRIRRIKD